MRDAHIVVQNGNDAECLPCGRDGRLDRCESGDVCSDGYGLPTFRRDDCRRFLGRLHVDVDTGDPGALTRIKHGGSLAVAPAGA